MIEQVLIKKTLKAGETIWAEGSIVNSPLPKILLEEIERKTGTVKVVKERNSESPNKLVFVAEKVEEKSGTTMTSEIQTKSGPSVVENLKPKPKFKRRKK